jgi:hypothetical protein
LLLATALYYAVSPFDLWSQRDNIRVKALSGAEQEIAYIEPATSAEDWERLVSAVNYLRRDWPLLFPEQPPLRVSFEHAFPLLTADVPEIALWFGEDGNQMLLLRWYKISGEHDIASWVEALRRRAPPPLAVLGGGSSGRATRLAQNLAKARDLGWAGQAPAFLISFATAEVDARAPDHKLLYIYAAHSFRYAFANPLMVEAVLRFVRQHPQVWTHKEGTPAVLAAAAASADPWGALGLLCASGHFQPNSLHTFHWKDDSYSGDLADAFRDEFARRDPHGAAFDEGTLPYSVGDFYHPTPPEQLAVSTLLANRSPFPPHSLLVLPTSAQRMRRVLGNLRSRAPFDVRNLLVVNGDAITFHTVYRDRDYAWNIQDLPFSLVFFSHRNPIDGDYGFGWQGDARQRLSTTGTHDLLLYRDIVESVVHAAFAQGRLLSAADEFMARLRETRWYQADADRRSGRVYNGLVHPWAAAARPLFDAAGTRQPHTGEHIVWLRPNYSGDHLDLVSTVFVWQASADPSDAIWRLVAAHEASYNQPRLEGE